MSLILLRRVSAGRGFPKIARNKHVLADAASHPKYGPKIREVAKRKNMNVEKLREVALAEARTREKLRAAEVLASATRAVPAGVAPKSSASAKPPYKAERKDSSPFVPLSTFLNLSKIQASPHTAEQVEQLWKLYHASRSNGTGRGFVCATLPSDMYKNMLTVAGTYPSFVTPIQRENTVAVEGESRQAHEFYFLQWSHYDAPAVPSADADLFAAPVTSAGQGQNSRVSTVLFTPLAEYKLRQTFATPHLVVTFYTDLESSHGIVLMRGEITPATAGDGRYLLTQLDAQLLSLGLQNYYLWSDHEKSRTGAALLKTFHKQPENFKWEDLIALSEVTA